MKNSNIQTIDLKEQVTIEAETRAEAVEQLNALRKQAGEKGLEATGGFIVFDFEKSELGEKPFSATLKFNPKKQ